MASVRLTIENERPISENDFYSGMHHMERSRIAKEARFLVKLELMKLDEKPDFNFPVMILVLVYFDKYPYDSDNIVRKMCIDGLIKSEANPQGIIPDDHMKYVSFSGSIPRIDRERPRVEILITDVSVDIMVEMEEPYE